MLEQLVESLGASTTSALLGPFLVLLLCGLGLPLPEDIVLIASGVLGAREGIPFITVSILMYFGIVLGDSTVFILGKKIGVRALRTRLGERLIGQAAVDKASASIRRWGAPILFVARFLPGLRSPIFFTAGMLGFKYYRFLLLDSLAAIISAPAFVWLGYWSYRRFQNNFSEVEKVLAEWQPVILSVVAISAVLGLLFLFIRRKTLPGKRARP